MRISVRLGTLRCPEHGKSRGIFKAGSRYGSPNFRASTARRIETVSNDAFPEMTWLETPGFLAQPLKELGSCWVFISPVPYVYLLLRHTFLGFYESVQAVSLLYFRLIRYSFFKCS
jgi:hypothetical protein